MPNLGLTATWIENGEAHGGSLKVSVQFSADYGDERGWVVDFGGLKSFKSVLEDHFDHKFLLAEDDPLLDTFKKLEVIGVCELRILPATGCAKFAEYLFGVADAWLYSNGYSPRVKVHSVEVLAHDSDVAVYSLPVSETVPKPEKKP